VPTPAGAIPITNFTERVPAPRVAEIERKDGQRVYTIGADVADGVLADDIVQELRAWLADEIWPADVTFEFRGEDEEQAAASRFLMQAFAVALFLITMILVTQFNSFYQAFLILSAVVFSTVGVMLGLLVTDQPFGIIMSGVGVIALAGIVVNNNIVLIDTYNELRRKGLEPFEAVLRTGAQRLRPVMLTTVTTILGLMPMVLKVNLDFFSRTITHGGPSTDWWAQLASAVAGGLAFATLLTLVLTPCLLYLPTHYRLWWQGRRTDETVARAEPVVGRVPLPEAAD
jgi:multidrug efflux pump